MTCSTSANIIFRNIFFYVLLTHFITFLLRLLPETVQNAGKPLYIRRYSTKPSHRSVQFNGTTPNLPIVHRIDYVRLHISTTWYEIAMQGFLVVYHGISHSFLGIFHGIPLESKVCIGGVHGPVSVTVNQTFNHPLKFA